MLNVAIIGTGNVADMLLAPALGAVSGAQLWSVCSRVAERAEAFAKAHAARSPRPVYDDLGACLEDPELDAVIIATPDALHAEQTIRAARAKKHVLCEKPMATSVDDGRRMIDACGENGVRLAIAYHHRWHAGHRAVAESLKGGVLGDLRHMRVQWTYRAQNDSNWRARREVGRWWSLAGVGTHCVDMLRWWMIPSCGEVSTVRSLIARDVWKGPNDETALLHMRFESGATAELLTSVLFESERRVELYGTSGSAICTGTLGPYGEGRIFVRGEEQRWEISGPYEGEIADFVAAIRDGREPEVNGEEGLRNVEILVHAAP